MRALGAAVLALVLAGSLWFAYGTVLVAHGHASVDPLLFNDDARAQIPPFMRWRDPRLFADDYLVDYYLACLPIGYRALYELGARVADPMTLSKIVPYGLLAVLLAGVALGAGRLGGVMAAWSACALTLSSAVYLTRMCGGLPRAFAFPLVACAAAATTWGRPLALAVVVVVAAGFYPAMAVVAGLALTLLLLALPAADRGAAAHWSFRWRVAVVAATAAAAGLVVAPTAVRSARYGRTLGAADVRLFPEAGPDGRYIALDRPPFEGLVPGIAENARKALVGAGPPFAPGVHAWTERIGPSRVLGGILVVIVLGWLPLAARDPAARRLLALALAVALGYLVARALHPWLFLPQRYVAYPLPVLVTVMLAAAGAGLAHLLGPVGRLPLVRGIAVGAVTVTVLALLDGPGSSRAGLHRHDDLRLYAFLRSLPPEAMVAGWPADVVNNVPYLAQRSAFVTFETHQAFHEGFVQEMRHRMSALIEAYFAHDQMPLRRLRDEFGVTHLLLDVRHRSAPPTRYFAPFDAWAASARARGAPPAWLVARLDAATVFTDGPYVVVDLARLDSPAVP